MVARPNPSWTFQPLFELGRGGVAVVRAERAIDEHGHARVLAVKRLLPMVAESVQTRTMFLDEAELAALVEHPNVVRIFAHGQQDEPFIAMELVLGETLASLVSRASGRNERPLDPQLALHVCAEVCGGYAGLRADQHIGVVMGGCSASRPGHGQLNAEAAGGGITVEGVGSAGAAAIAKVPTV